MCPDPACEAHDDLDEFGRRRSVELHRTVQGFMGPAGHHLLNRAADGSLGDHLSRVRPTDVVRVLETEVAPERARVRAYLDLLERLERGLTETWESAQRPARPGDHAVG